MPTINSPTPDATTTSKGKVQLAGDLTGTAAAPVLVPGFIVNAGLTNFSAASTTTSVIPIDDTTPQTTEGAQFMSMAWTPKSATNTLYIQVIMTCSFSVAGWLQMALTNNTAGTTLAATGQYQSAAGGFGNLNIAYSMVAGTTSPITFGVRGGGDQAGTFTFNGVAGVRRYGGVPLSSIMITEQRS